MQFAPVETKKVIAAGGRPAEAQAVHAATKVRGPPYGHRGSTPMATVGDSPRRETCFSLLELCNEEATNATPKKRGRAACAEEDTYTTPQTQQNGTEATGKVEIDSTDTAHSGKPKALRFTRENSIFGRAAWVKEATDATPQNQHIGTEATGQANAALRLELEPGLRPQPVLVAEARVLSPKEILAPQRSLSPKVQADLPEATAVDKDGAAAAHPPSPERCAAFSAAFNEVRGEDGDEPLDRTAALAAIAARWAARGLAFSAAEAAQYLEAMAVRNAIMLAEDKIYII